MGYLAHYSSKAGLNQDCLKHTDLLIHKLKIIIVPITQTRKCAVTDYWSIKLARNLHLRLPAFLLPVGSLSSSLSSPLSITLANIQHKSNSPLPPQSLQTAGKYWENSYRPADWTQCTTSWSLIQLNH